MAVRHHYGRTHRHTKGQAGDLSQAGERGSTATNLSSSLSAKLQVMDLVRDLFTPFTFTHTPMTNLESPMSLTVQETHVKTGIMHKLCTLLGL